jgi:hypothetical protein
MTRYEQGFMNKCAEYGVDGAELAAYMQKQALSLDAAKNVIARLPGKLKSFFSKTRTMSHPVTSISRLPGVYSAPATTEGLETVTKVGPDWGRILAALGITGGTAGLATMAGNGSSAAAPVAETIAHGLSPRAKALLLALGATGAGAAGYAAAKSKRDEDKKKKK